MMNYFTESSLAT